MSDGKKQIQVITAIGSQSVKDQMHISSDNICTNAFKYHLNMNSSTSALICSSSTINPSSSTLISSLSKLNSSASTLILPSTVPLDGVASGQLGVHQSNVMLSYAGTTLGDLTLSRAPLYIPAAAPSTLVTPYQHSATFTAAAAIVEPRTINGISAQTSLLPAITSLSGNGTLVSVSTPVIHRPIVATSTSISQNLANSEQIYNLSIRLPTVKQAKPDDLTKTDRSLVKTICEINSTIDSRKQNFLEDSMEQIPKGSGIIKGHIAEQVITVIGGSDSASIVDNNRRNKITGRLIGLNFHKPDDEKLQRIQQIVEGCIR